MPPGCPHSQEEKKENLFLENSWTVWPADYPGARWQLSMRKPPRRSPLCYPESQAPPGGTTAESPLQNFKGDHEQHLGKCGSDHSHVKLFGKLNALPSLDKDQRSKTGGFLTASLLVSTRAGAHVKVPIAILLQASTAGQPCSAEASKVTSRLRH